MAAHLRDVHHVGHEGEALQFELGDVGLQQDVDLGTQHKIYETVSSDCYVASIIPKLKLDFTLALGSSMLSLTGMGTLSRSFWSSNFSS